MTQVINALTLLNLLNNVLSIASTVFTTLIFIGLFRKFYPEHYLLATVLSVLGFFPIAIFAVRNRKAVNYNDYIRSRYYGRGFNPYVGTNMGRPPYGFPGGANGQEENKTEKQPPNPFSEFDDDKQDDNPFGM